MKTLSYLDNVLAMAEARGKGSADALMLSFDGHVSSTSMANIFVLNGSMLSTSRRADSILPGVMREAILALGPALGLEPVERALNPDDLYRADLVFVTNSLRLMTRVVALDGVALSQKADAIWQSLQSAIEADIAAKCGAFPVRQKTG
jgi:branched-chain amino acid aminotransferase